MTHGKEKLTQEQRETLLHENIAEIGTLVGCLISSGAFPKSDLDVPSTDVSQSIISWAKEFEDKYQGPDFDYSKGVPELGNPAGYLDAIDHFTELKMREAKWLTEDYMNDKNRFWNMEYYVDIEFRVTRTIKVTAVSDEHANSQAQEWWDQVSLEEATADADNMDEFCIREVLSVQESEKWQ
ncbi:hypothetical protein [Paenibacillus gallinarum]|uniref:Uncharacterized protein n=1 Tax=Paenibacillus gallinarum TaxID=2762232 RepID=A0ABR8T3D0_9BACL|nr:hypothetical protein [Paenibacillus gallinarum]MBD7970262.1 hypothetical protein [Paenibacillus gallinarum]